MGDLENGLIHKQQLIVIKKYFAFSISQGRRFHYQSNGLKNLYKKIERC
jgi:hypothetical protein